MNTPMTATHVFYSASQKCIIDTCTDENPPRSHIQGLTIHEMHVYYPDAVYMLFDEACRIMEEKDRLPVSEIDREQWWEMLEVLPPQGWKQTGDEESFKLMEHWSGNITNIYARIGERYFMLRDSFLLPHAEVISRCKAYIKGL